MADFVGAVDQGSTSTRFMVFDHDGNEVGKHQLEHKQILPRAGWVEHNPIEIWERTQTVIGSALTQLRLQASDLVALGLTNQRETTVVWDRRTGRPLYNAIVWQDTRTDRIAAALDRDRRGEVIRQRAGLPPATYFSACKVQWILENVDGVREAAERGDALFGTTDSWLLWNLTGGTRGGAHVTDVTNASRTMLMDLQTLDWDEELLGFFDIPRAMLPTIRPSSPVQLTALPTTAPSATIVRSVESGLLRIRDQCAANASSSRAGTAAIRKLSSSACQAKKSGRSPSSTSRRDTTGAWLVSLTAGSHGSTRSGTASSGSRPARAP
jgi:glycerol kinase